MPADSSPVQGRVLSGASLRQAVGVKPWEKALVQERTFCLSQISAQPIFSPSMAHSKTDKRPLGSPDAWCSKRRR